MNYAIHYSPVSDSVALAWEDGDESTQFMIENPRKEKKDKPPKKRVTFFKRIKKVEGKRVKREDFIHALTSQDVIWMELGGLGDRFARKCASVGASVYRIPTTQVSNKEERAKRQQMWLEQQADKSRRRKLDSLATVIARKLYQMAGEQPEKFYPYRQVDERINDIANFARYYLSFQRKLRVAHTNRSEAIRRDLELIGGEAGNPELSRYEKLIMADEETLKVLQKEEDELLVVLKRLVKSLPLAQYIFGTIPGTGPVIQGLVIGEIGDIRRFDTLPQLKSLAGYGLKQDPETGDWHFQRLVKGQLASRNGRLKTAVDYFVKQMTLQSPSHPWKQRLEGRYFYAVEKLLKKAKDNGQNIPPELTARAFIAYVREHQEQELPYESYGALPARARRDAEKWLGQKYLQYVLHMWRRFEGISDEAVV